MRPSVPRRNSTSVPFAGLRDDHAVALVEGDRRGRRARHRRRVLRWEAATARDHELQAVVRLHQLGVDQRRAVRPEVLGRIEHDGDAVRLAATERVPQHVERCLHDLAASLLVRQDREGGPALGRQDEERHLAVGSAAVVDEPDAQLVVDRPRDPDRAEDGRRHSVRPLHLVERRAGQDTLAVREMEARVAQQVRVVDASPPAG